MRVLLFLSIGSMWLLTSCTSITPKTITPTDIKSLAKPEIVRHNFTSRGESLFYTYPFEYSDLGEVGLLSGISRILTVEDGCLYLLDGNEKTLPIFPAGTTWDKDNQTLKYFNKIYQVGDTIHAGGFSLNLQQEKESKKYLTKATIGCEVSKMTWVQGLPTESYYQFY